LVIRGLINGYFGENIMPLPALPALTAAARFILAKGTREAVKKYGKTAIKKAKDLIKKRDKAIEKRKRQGTPEERGLDTDYHRVRSPLEQRELDIKESARMAGSELRKQAGKVPIPREGAPLKLKKGGFVPKTAKVRGAGRAIRGVRPAKLY